MRVLVTGASGFVGRALCCALHARGYQVRGAVRDPASAADLPAELIPVRRFDGGAPWPVLLDDVDVVIHLAARVHVMKDTAADPLAEFRAVNVAGTEAIARAAAERGVTRLVYVSSIKVNGEHTHGAPFTERDAPRPQDPYGTSKWEAEQTLRALAHETGLAVTIVRPPLVYGPQVRGNFLRLLKLVRSGIPLPFGAVNNRRSMIYVGNLVDALIACSTVGKAAGRTYLASDGEDLSTAALLDQVGRAMHKRTRLWHIPIRWLRAAGLCAGRGDEISRLVDSLCVDSSALRAELGWRPPYSVVQGVQETVHWFQGLRG